MVAVPQSAIIIINNDLTQNVKNKLIRQLHLTQVLDGYVFDALITADSSYIDNLRANGQRIMVVRSLQEETNRDKADVVLFAKNGLVYILENGFGPPGATFPIVNLYWGQLGIFQ